MAAARSQGAHRQIEGAHRRGGPPDQGAGRSRIAQREGRHADRFHRDRPAHQTAGLGGSDRARTGRPHAVPRSQFRALAGHAIGTAGPQRHGQDHAAAPARGRTGARCRPHRARGGAAHGLFRPGARAARPLANSARRPGRAWRSRHLPRSADPRGRMGQALPVRLRRSSTGRSRAFPAANRRAC